MAELSARELDLEIDNLSTNLESLNEDIKRKFDEYTKSKSTMLVSTNICKDSQTLINSLAPFEGNVADQVKKYVCDLNGELNSLSSKMVNTVECYVFIKKILDLDQSLLHVKEYMSSDAYRASEHLVKAKVYLDECSKSGRSLEFYRQKNEEYYNLLTNVSMSTIEQWNDLVSFKMSEQEGKVKSSSLIVSQANLGSLETVFQTLELLRVNYKETFRDHFVKDLIKPIILYNCDTNIEDKEDCSVFSVCYTTKPTKLEFNDVVSRLKKLFSFMNSTLDLKFQPNSFISLIGAVTASEFMRLFIEEHLSKKIPLKRSQLSEYADAVNITNDLLSTLYEKGFLSRDDNLVKEYCLDVDTVYEAKVGTRYKEVAITYMKEDLHDMMQIDEISLTYPIPDLKQISLSLDENNKENWNSFISLLNSDSRKSHFLECQISKSIYELVNLVQICLEEAAQSKSTLSICLQDTAHEIVYEYVKSPDIHRKLLDIIPQQSALVYNNTMYLIMKLVQFDNTINSEPFFGELISQLHILAYRELNKQIKIQEDIMISSIQKSGLQDLSELEVFPKMVEKVVRQCMRQVMLLQTVWINVLPKDIYCLMIGRLVNRFIEEVINFIISASDIREDIANKLVDIIIIITEKSQYAFPESREVHRFVKSWLKLQEVRFILASSLAEISERWAGGCGPLAHELQPSQVRSLILALFQQSDIRQRIIATIK